MHVFDAAARLFEKLMGLANDVGLYSEQLDVKNKMVLGNFPRAFSHPGPITAALSISEAQWVDTTIAFRVDRVPYGKALKPE